MDVGGGGERQVDRGEGHTDRRVVRSCGGRRGCRYATAVRMRVGGSAARWRAPASGRGPWVVRSVDLVRGDRF